MGIERRPNPRCARAFAAAMSINRMSMRTCILGSLVATSALALFVVTAEVFGLGSFRFEFAMLSALAVIPLLLGLLAATWRGTRALASRAILIGLIPLLLLYPSLTIASRARRAAFARLADRSSPLVSAIRTYERRHGVPPPSLAALVPKELPLVPKTGMRAYPDYSYVRSDPSALPSRRPRWELSVPCSTGGTNADEFVYWPDEDYPTTTGSGDFERIRHWAYLHE
jgi:hypothetical protein